MTDKDMRRDTEKTSYVDEGLFGPDFVTNPMALYGEPATTDVPDADEPDSPLEAYDRFSAEIERLFKDEGTSSLVLLEVLLRRVNAGELDIPIAIEVGSVLNQVEADASKIVTLSKDAIETLSSRARELINALESTKSDEAAEKIAQLKQFIAYLALISRLDAQSVNTKIEQVKRKLEEYLHEHHQEVEAFEEEQRVENKKFWAKVHQRLIVDTGVGAFAVAAATILSFLLAGRGDSTKPAQLQDRNKPVQVDQIPEITLSIASLAHLYDIDQLLTETSETLDEVLAKQPEIPPGAMVTIEAPANLRPDRPIRINETAFDDLLTITIPGPSNYNLRPEPGTRVNRIAVIPVGSRVFIFSPELIQQIWGDSDVLNTYDLVTDASRNIVTTPGTDRGPWTIGVYNAAESGEPPRYVLGFISIQNSELMSQIPTVASETPSRTPTATPTESRPSRTPTPTPTSTSHAPATATQPPVGGQVPTTEQTPVPLRTNGAPATEPATQSIASTVTASATIEVSSTPSATATIRATETLRAPTQSVDPEPTVAPTAIRAEELVNGVPLADQLRGSSQVMLEIPSRAEFVADDDFTSCINCWDDNASQIIAAANRLWNGEGGNPGLIPTSPDQFMRITQGQPEMPALNFAYDISQDSRRGTLTNEYRSAFNNGEVTVGNHRYFVARIVGPIIHEQTGPLRRQFLIVYDIDTPDPEGIMRSGAAITVAPDAQTYLRGYGGTNLLLNPNNEISDIIRRLIDHQGNQLLIKIYKDFPLTYPDFPEERLDAQFGGILNAIDEGLPTPNLSGEITTEMQFYLRMDTAVLIFDENASSTVASAMGS